MKWKWFAVVGVAVLLGACEPRALFQPLGSLIKAKVGEEFPLCPYPSGEVPKTETNGCFYKLDVSAVDPTCDEVQGKIARSVVIENIKQPIYREIFPDQPADKYPFSTYTFKVNKRDFKKVEDLLKAGKGTDIEFCAPAGSAVLTTEVPPHPKLGEQQKPCV